MRGRGRGGATGATLATALAFGTLLFRVQPASAQRDSGTLHLRLSVQEGAHVGRKAPPIVLPYATRDSAGPASQPFDLAKELGHVVIVVFFPGDASPGAAEDWRAIAHHEGPLAAGVVLAGISPDSIAVHVRFARLLDLPYKLLSDPKLVVARQYAASRGDAIQSDVIVIGRGGTVRYVDPAFSPRDVESWRPVDAAVRASLGDGKP